MAAAAPTSAAKKLVPFPINILLCLSPPAQDTPTTPSVYQK